MRTRRMPTSGWKRYVSAASPCLQELIEKINGHGSDDEKISCVISDVTADWALEVTKRMGIEAVGFWPAGVSCILQQLHIPKLFEDGAIDEDGILLQIVTIKISHKIPSWNSNALTWSNMGDPTQQRALFGFVKAITKYSKHTNIFLCNSFVGIEPSALERIPGILPVGRLTVTNISKDRCTGSLLAEDSTCMDWLAEQGDKSVVYVALGSLTVLTKHQFEELAAGLKDIGRPFLWVVRPDLLDGGSSAELLDEFLKRVQDRAKIVAWAPQERVLAHKSTACLLNHCGWNSALEGLSNKNNMPFICFPYCGDHFQNSVYILDVWKVGVKLVPDGNRVAARQEVKDMVRESISKEGSSTKNLMNYIENRW